MAAQWLQPPTENVEEIPEPLEMREMPDFLPVNVGIETDGGVAGPGVVAGDVEIETHKTDGADGGVAGPGVDVVDVGTETDGGVAGPAGPGVDAVDVGVETPQSALCIVNGVLRELDWTINEVQDILTLHVGEEEDPEDCREVMTHLVLMMQHWRASISCLR